MGSRNNHLVIMAGGVGSRFWPMSTVEKPKQFIDVLGVGKSLLQLTVERFSGICKPENVWIVTNKAYVNIVKEQLPDLPAGNILCEPCRRNTAINFAALCFPYLLIFSQCKRKHLKFAGECAIIYKLTDNVRLHCSNGHPKTMHLKSFCGIWGSAAPVLP